MKAFFLLLLVLCSLHVSSRDRVNLITYGAGAPGKEGDDDYMQHLIIKVPVSESRPVYLRIFDADCGGNNDDFKNVPDTSTRFTLYSGEPEWEAVKAGKAGGMLKTVDFGIDPAHDNAWQVFHTIEPATEEQVFTLVVRGLSGDDANVYRLELSSAPNRNLEVPGALIWGIAPTFRLDKPGSAELKLATSDLEELQVGNFDAAGALVTLETRYRTIPLESSGQGAASLSKILLEPEEKGLPLALVLHADGGEWPNDVTMSINEATGEAVPVILPILAGPPNNRPVIELNTYAMADCDTVTFDGSTTKDPDGDRMNFIWWFGDGEQGRGSSLTHRYPRPGTYNARLVVADASGHVGHASLQSFEVVVNQPPVAVAGEDKVLAPRAAAIYNGAGSGDADGAVTKYLWDFGDGKGANGDMVSHSYDLPGRYVATLTVEDNSGTPCNTHRDHMNVWVNEAPIAIAGRDRYLSIGEESVFDGRSSHDPDGELISWSWDFGDSHTAVGESVTHAWQQGGTYKVSLQVQDNASVSNSGAEDFLTVYVNKPPIAVAGDDRLVGIGQTSMFDAGASSDPYGRIARYEWDFGDGNKGIGRIAPHAYQEAGRYKVTLTVIDDFKGVPARHQDQLIVRVNAPPRADAGPEQVITGSRVSFDGSASSDPDGDPLEWMWDFGDGTTGSGSKPTHVYKRPGLYRVTLVVDDGTGAGNASDSAHTRVTINRRPSADAGSDRVAAPGEVLAFDAYGSFDDDGEITGYQWDFGDGASALGARTQHAYAQPGLYRVRLTVFDETGQTRAVDFHELDVHVNQKPRAVPPPDILAAPGDEIVLDGSDSYDPDGALEDWYWVLDDGREFRGPVIKTSFERAGIMTAILTVTDNSGATNGQDSAQVTIHINAKPEAVAGDPLHTCENQLIFDGSQSLDGDGDALTWHWNFGDGNTRSGMKVSHQFAEGGVYPVVLTVNDGSGVGNASHSDTRLITINRAPIAVAGPDMTVCAGEVAVLDGGASSDPDDNLLEYHWDLGDGTESELVNPVKVYKTGGLYKVTLTVTDDTGLECGRDVDELVIFVAESPVARAGEDLDVCANSPVRFDGSASVDTDGVVNRFHWDFGDNTSGGGPTPEHAYTKPGTYTVTLTVTGDRVGDCDNTDTDEVVVTVHSSPSVEIIGPSTTPQGMLTSYRPGVSEAEAGDITWEWRVGDTVLAQTEILEHAFSEAGTFFLELLGRTGSNDSCGTVRVVETITVNAAPEPDGGPDRLVGVDEPVVFDASASTDSDGKITLYKWDFGDGNTAEGLVVTHRYRQSGNYTARLTVRDSAAVANSEVTRDIPVRVNSEPQPRIRVVSSSCAGAEIVLDAASSTDEDGHELSHQWLFGDGGSASGERVTHTYAKPGRYQITLTSDDGTGTGNSVIQTTAALLVNTPPHAMAGPDRVVCPGDEQVFDGALSRDPDGGSLTFAWNFGDGTTADSSRARHSWQQEGSYEVNLTVTDDSGSSCAQTIDTALIRVNQSPIAMAGGDRTAFTGGADDEQLFDAGASTDPDGDPLFFEWDFGDNNRKTGSRVFHAWSEPGIYEVTLTVSDDTGLPCGKSIDRFTVTVKDHSEAGQ